jgi:hypothetical protein
MAPAEWLPLAGGLGTILLGIWRVSAKVTTVQNTVTTTSGDLTQVKAELKENTKTTNAMDSRVSRIEGHLFGAHITHNSGE